MLVVSNILLGLSSLAFGFSVHIAMAVVFRFSVGLTNGKLCFLVPSVDVSFCDTFSVSFTKNVCGKYT